MGQEAVRRIGQLYEIEREIHGMAAEERRRVRLERAKPLLDSFEKWLQEQLEKFSKKSAGAKAIQYSLGLWPALVRYCGDGRIEIDNNAAERALRAVAIGRKNYLFAGSDTGGERAAAIYTLIGSAKLNGVDPAAYLRFGDGGGGALRGLICGAMPDHGLAGVSMRGGSDGYEDRGVSQDS
jgi:hypothetical protein